MHLEVRKKSDGSGDDWFGASFVGGRGRVGDHM